MTDIQRAYDRLGTRYSRWTRILERTALNRMRESVLGGRRGEILEVAICDGKNLRYYERGSRVVGVDLSPVMLDLAQRKARDLHLDFTPIVSDVSRLNFPDASFDHVVCSLGGCTFSDPESVFREMRRVLRPTGRALFIEHVRPESEIGQFVMNAITPITSRILGCHPNRDTARTIQDSGLRFEKVEQALGGILLGIEAERI